ncbi:MAG: FAD/NAD(P)-binding protein [Candidatus Bathyarchaeia archaeon]
MIDLDNPFMPRRAFITGIVDETYDTKTFTFEFVENRRRGMEFKPGQFVMLSIFGYGEAAISIASDMEDPSHLELTIRRVGDVTGALFNLREGDQVGIRGPYGNSWPLSDAEGKELLLVIGGCGCGTLRPVILSHRRDPGRLKSLEILYGARTPGDIIYRKHYEGDWARIPNTRVLLSVDRVAENTVWNHEVGVVTTLFKYLETDPGDGFVFICGPEIMMKYSVIGLLKLGFKPDRIFCSMERRMRCGFGLCGHCQLGSKYVCKDGPIFSYTELKQLPDHMVRC